MKKPLDGPMSVMIREFLSVFDLAALLVDPASMVSALAVGWVNRSWSFPACLGAISTFSR